MQLEMYRFMIEFSEGLQRRYIFGFWKIQQMEKKDSSLPKMTKKPQPKDQLLSFKVRPNLATKDKQNKLQKSMHQAMAKNFINKAKSFNSPELIFALNDSIRFETSAGQGTLQSRNYRQSVNHNKTFHSFGLPSRPEKVQPKHYAVNEQREKALQLSKWMKDKLQVLKTKKQVTLDDILDYNQTVVNFGLGEIIESVRKRCKEQGQSLKIIWDNTFVLFEGLLNVLSEQLKEKDIEMINSEKELEKIYLNNLAFVNKKNQQLEEHLDLLYERMKKIIIWNRTLRKDRFKQEIRMRVKDYRLATYSSALEEATAMLLAESKEPDCLKLAKKIISKLYRGKNFANMGKKGKEKKEKPLSEEAREYVNGQTRSFVMGWLKKYSFEDEEKLQGAVYLTQDQKLQIIKITDQNEANQVDIYDFFQTKSIKVQTEFETRQKSVQYEEDHIEKKTKTVGVQTKKVYSKSVCIQVNQPMEGVQKSKSPNRNLKRKQTIEGFKKGKSKNSSIKNKIEPKFGQKNTSIKNLLGNIQSQGQNISQMKIDEINDGIEAEFDDGDSEQEWGTKNQTLDFDDRISQVPLHGNEEEKKLKSFRYDSEMRQLNNRNSKSLRSIKNNQNNFDVQNKFKLEELIEKKLRSKMLSQKFITQSDEPSSQSYKPRPLQVKRFDEVYQKEMKNQYNQNKDEMIRTVIRRRSFYKPNRNRKLTSEKALMFLWYRPNKYLETKNKKQWNQLDENIYNYFNSLIKNLTLPYNYTKSKIYNQTCSLFSSVSGSLNPLQRTVPKNKQFINLSVTAITKFISRLIFDYLRKIRGDFEGIPIQLERVHYPLSVILVDHMMHKYGLKEIAEKKLRDFMEKVSNFIGVSERMNFFYRLLGVGEQMMSADELIIYMKCLVYFDIKKTIPIQNISKDFTVERAMTDKETVLAYVDQIIKEFFREDRREQVKWKIERYFHIYQLSGMFDIERIAAMLIDEFITFKKEEYQHFVPIYKNCQGNFFPNLLKIVAIFCETEILSSKYTRIIQEMFKNADLLDENFGKSISELRFVGLCVRLGFPKYEQIKEKLTRLKKEVVPAMGITEEYSIQSDEMLSKVRKKYNIRIAVDRDSPDYWLWSCAQIGYDVPLMNAYSLLGNLKFLNSTNSP